ncbi:hypothetical protein DTL42_02295 [Bremerella cremea]|uniref:Uncharacterized protein n=1 Tax=Bremerella cremea TaxID=1031537 RepID=A0A368KWI7_9BACT|nr:hypothetical protein [Bremerella cremea]RCS54007.1 hypothetical protein DTL42_02295 [Bremerella cremea]
MGVENQIRAESECLSSSEIDELWKLFSAIHTIWGNDTACRVEDMASRWREFIELKVSETPSYLKRYTAACDLLSDLRASHGDGLYQYLLVDGELHRQSDPGLVNLKRNVIDEFILVYVSSGGFRSFGGKNYTGFVSGSRFRSQRTYRTYEDA